MSQIFLAADYADDADGRGKIGVRPYFLKPKKIGV
jgi:hypothetical protein